MKIVLSSHAQERIIERNIKKGDVIDTIKDPDITCPTRHKHRKRVMKSLNNATLDVIIEEKDGKIIVVTCAILRKED